MIEQLSWRYVDNGGGGVTVCLPGWATDGRIFSSMRHSSNLIIPTGMTLPADLDSLAEYLRREQLPPVTLLGWSLGGFLAVDFARAHPTLVRRVVLVGIRCGYPPMQIATMQQALAQDAGRCLTAFYRQCFLPAQRTDYRDFHARLEPAYLRELALADLQAGLVYLTTASLTPDTLPDCPVTIVHGAQDVIAPVEEAQRLGKDAGAALHILPGFAHAAFLAPEMAGLIC